MSEFVGRFLGKQGEHAHEKGPHPGWAGPRLDRRLQHGRPLGRALAAGVVQQVRVPLLGDDDTAEPEPVEDFVQRFAAGDAEHGAGVPQIMEPDGPHPGLLDQPAERLRRRAGQVPEVRQLVERLGAYLAPTTSCGRPASPSRTPPTCGALADAVGVDLDEPI